MSNLYNIYQQITSVRLAAVVNLDGVYFNGPINNGIGATLTAATVGHLSVDSVSVDIGDRILLFNQTDPGQNGIYVVNQTGSPISLWVLERSSDFQSLEQIKAGQYFSVSAGAIAAGSMYVVNEPLPSSIGPSSSGFIFSNVADSGSVIGPYLLKAANLSDLNNRQDAFGNFGLGSGQTLILTDADFTGGIYTLTNPCPNFIRTLCATPGNKIRLPVANSADSFALSQGPNIAVIPTFEGVEVDTASGVNLLIQDSPSSWTYHLSDNSTSDGSWSIFGVVESVNNMNGIVDLNIPTITPIAQQLWVNAADGNDSNSGDISSPFATFDHAYSVAIASASPTNQYLIHVIGDQSPSGNFTISPYVHVDGHNSGTITPSLGQILADSSWSSSSNSIVYIKNCKFSAGSGMTLNFVAGLENIINFDYCDFDGVPSLYVTANNTNASPNDVVITNTTFSSGTGPFSGGTVVQDAILIIKNSPVQNLAVTCTGSGGSASAAGVLVNCTVSGAMQVTDSGTGALAILNLQTSPMSSSPGISGPNALMIVEDISSYTYIPTFSSGATISQVSIKSLTDGALQTSYTPVNYTPIGSSSYSANSLTANLAGIDAALAGVGGGGIAQQLWVNFTDGDDANSGENISSPLKTLDQAITNANIIASPTNMVLINVIGDQPSISSAIFPNIIIDGTNSGTLTYTGNLSSDSVWETLTDGYALFKNCIFSIPFLSQISIYFGLGVRNIIEFDNCNFSDVSTANIAANPTSTDPNTVIFKDMQYVLGTTPFSSGVEVSDSALIVYNGTMVNLNVVCNGASGTVGSNCKLFNSTISGVTFITDLGTGAIATLELNNSSIASPQLSGTNAYLYSDVTSYNTIPSLAGGATINQVIISSLSDGLLQTSYTPVNFTPDNTGGDYAINSETAMIHGIDNALGAIAPSSPISFSAYLSTNVSNVTGDGTNYTVICDSQSGPTSPDYNSSTGVFTAPSDGFYNFNMGINITTPDAGQNALAMFLNTTSNTYVISGLNLLPITYAGGNSGTLVGSQTVFLNTGDTASFSVQVSGGSLDCTLISSTNPIFTFFSGSKVQSSSTPIASVAFCAYASAAQNNVTGAGTVYTVQFDTQYGTSSPDYNTGTGTFTAPKSGFYQFSAAVNLASLDSGMTSMKLILLINGTQQFALAGNNPFAGKDGADYTSTGAATVYLNASDTVNITCQVSGGAGDNAQIYSTSNPIFAYFSGSYV